MKTWCIIVGALVSLHTAVAQVPADSAYEAAVQRGIAAVYNLEFENADREFATLVSLRPQHPAGYFFQAMVIWWRIMIDIDNRSYDDRFYQSLDTVVDMCDSILDVNPDDLDAIFFKGGALGFEGRLRFHRDDWLGAANAGRKALPLVQRASALDPDNYDIYLGTGIYNYYAEVIPNEYPFVRPLLLFVPAGNRAKGLQQLTLAAERGRYASVETTYFLMQIYYNYEKDFGQTLRLAQALHTRFPGNMLFHKYVGRAYVSLNNWERAEETFREIVDKARRGVRGYTPAVEREAVYYLGFGAISQNRLADATAQLQRCDELSRMLDTREPSGFMVMTNLKMGMVYDLQGRRDLAMTQYRKVLDMKEYKDSHAQAERYFEKPYAR